MNSGWPGAVVALAVSITCAVLISGCAVGLLNGAASSGGGSAPTSAASRTPSQSQMQADAALSTAVRSRLAADASLKALNLGVDTHDGVVTLSGRVAKVAQRQAAESAARSVKGVKSVQNRVTVRQ